MPMVNPCILLAILAAILCPPTSATLGELPCHFFPFSTSIVRTLSNSAPRIIFAAEVLHHHTRPVLHIFRMMANGELLHQGEGVEIIRLQVLLILVILVNATGAGTTVLLRGLNITIESQFRDEMRGLEKWSQIAVL
jgi:hypothetical protein